MVPGQTKILLCDIVSAFGSKKTVYGLKGEVVTIISNHGSVVIVEGETERFSVSESNFFTITNNAKIMKETAGFKKVIQDYLKDLSAKDPLFAETFKKEGKNIDDCITYILNTVKASGCAGFDDSEIFAMATHYYDEDKIKVGAKIDANVVINHHAEGRTEQLAKTVEALHHTLEPNKRKPKLSKSDIAAAKQKALDDIYKEARAQIANKRKKSPAVQQPISNSLFD